MSGEKPKLLLVDDSPDTLDLAEVFLYRDFDVFTAVNGFEGLKMARELSPDLIITDIMMPVVDGIRLFNDLRRQEKTAAIPVVAMTSFVKKITRKSLLNMGFNGVIAKPVERERLLAMAARLLSPASTPPEQQVTDETTT
ncbi:MAG: response regulator [Chitinispirillaceae bacterium]|nr:response regulator [Chitinispirillaceae bacterium]